jgi:hypothetical protein
MATYVGPNGRLYHRTPRRGLWTALALIAMALIGSIGFFTHL